MRYILICLIVASLIIPSQCVKHSPCYHVVLDLRTWLDIVRNDQRTIMDYDSIMNYDVKPSICSIKRAKLDESCEPLLRKVSCDVQHARWDYKFLGKGQKKNLRQDIYNGQASLIFNDPEAKASVGYREGMKNGKCFRVDKRVHKMTGTFHHDLPTGPVVVNYFSRAKQVVTVKDGQMTGPTKVFDKSGRLQYIKDIETGIKTVEISEVNANLTLFEGGLVMNAQDGEIYHCKQVKRFMYQGCRLLKNAQMRTSYDGNAFNFKLESMEPARGDGEFSLNTVTLEKHSDSGVTSDAELYPFCQKGEYWNKDGIPAALNSWITSCSERNDKTWFHPPIGEPPFTDDHKIEIELPHLARFNGPRPLLVFKEDKLIKHDLMDFQHGVITAKVGLPSEDRIKQTPLDDMSHPLNGSSVEDTLTPVETDLEDWSSGALEIILSKEKVQTFALGTGRTRDTESLVRIFGRLKKSKLDGFVRMFGTVPTDDEGFCASHSQGEDLSFVGHYENGSPSGISWKGLVGGAWLYGNLNPMWGAPGEFSGADIAYIYPDMTTAILGTFDNGILIHGREVEIVGEKCDSRGVKVLQFSEPKGPDFGPSQPPTSDDLGEQPTEGDPFSSRHVTVGPSKEVSGEEGLFAKHDLPAGTTVTTMHGFLDEGDKSTFNRNYYHKWTSSCGNSFYLTPEESNVENFKSSLGHKINHSFRHVNVMARPLETARLGVVDAFYTVKDVKRGDELLTFNRYSIKAGPKWYRQALIDYLREYPDAAEDDDTIASLIDEDPGILKDMTVTFKRLVTRSER